MKTQMKAKIIVDITEPDEVVNALIQIGHDVKKVNSKADYIIPSKWIGVERKSGADFIQSMLNGDKLRRQVKTLCHNFALPFLIVENLTDIEKQANEHLNLQLIALYNYIISIIADNPSLRVIPSANTLTTAHEISKLSERECKDTDFDLFLDDIGKSKDQYKSQMNLLMILPGIGAKKAEKIAEQGFGSTIEMLMFIADYRGKKKSLLKAKEFLLKPVKDSGLILKQDEEDTDDEEDEIDIDELFKESVK